MGALLMRAGQLRHRIVVVRDSISTTGSLGQETTVATTVTTVWGAVRPLTGKELFRAQQMQPEVTHRVTVRHSTNIVPNRYLQHDSRTLDILAVMDKDERRIEQEVLCKERI